MVVLLRFQSLPAEIIATIVSFVSKDRSEVFNVVTSILLVNNENENEKQQQREKEDNNNTNDTTTTTECLSKNNHEEDVYRALCLNYITTTTTTTTTTESSSLSLSSFPCFLQQKQIDSWKLQYQILADWFPRQGFYSILEAAPWGLLIRLTFDWNTGNFNGDLIWTVNDGGSSNTRSASSSSSNNTGYLPQQQHVQTIRILEIQFHAASSSSSCICQNNNTTKKDNIISSSSCEVSFHESIISKNCELSIVPLFFHNKDNNNNDSNDTNHHPRIKNTTTNEKYYHYHHSATIIPPVIISDCPSNEINDFAISIIQKKKMMMTKTKKVGRIPHTQQQQEEEGQRDIDQIWAPWSPASPMEMLQCLFRNHPKLTLDWVTTIGINPSNTTIPPSIVMNHHHDHDTTNQNVPFVPMKPGLYSAVYERIYGKYKREIILVEYVQYQLPPNNNNNNNNHVWEEIRTKIFNSPFQKDPEHLFDTIQNGIVHHHNHHYHPKNKNDEKDNNDNNNNESSTTTTTTLVFVIGRKVTGDFHVPMKQISFGALISPYSIRSDVHGDHPTRFRDRTRDDNDNDYYYSITQSFHGWGTLSGPLFASPIWSPGILVNIIPRQQTEEDDEDDEEQFGFVWRAQDRTPHGSIFTRIKGQDG